MTFFTRPFFFRAHILLVSFFTSLFVAAENPFPIYQPVILEESAYNSQWFTQGFDVDEDKFYISSGLYGHSQILVEKNKRKTKHAKLPNQYFAEGLTVIDDKIYLLTWKEKTLFIADKTSLKIQDQLTYQGEGWGLTHTDHFFIMSDGSNQLQFRDLQHFRLIQKITVPKLDKLNELEYINGIVWANRWYDDLIYAIDLNSGCPLAAIDLSTLRKKSALKDYRAVTNGIAYDEEKQGIWITGKLWRKRFLIELPTDIPSRNEC